MIQTSRKPGELVNCATFLAFPFLAPVGEDVMSKYMRHASHTAPRDSVAVRKSEPWRWLSSSPLDSLSTPIVLTLFVYSTFYSLVLVSLLQTGSWKAPITCATESFADVLPFLR